MFLAWYFCLLNCLSQLYDEKAKSPNGIYFYQVLSQSLKLCLFFNFLPRIFPCFFIYIWKFITVLLIFLFIPFMVYCIFEKHNDTSNLVYWVTQNRKQNTSSTSHIASSIDFDVLQDSLGGLGLEPDFITANTTKVYE